MDLVIDIQCYKDYSGRVAPKEVAVVALGAEYVAHWIVAPSRSVDLLSAAAKRENNWLTLNHHGIDYSEGDVTEKALFKTLRKILKDARKVYVRGKVKWSLLSDLTTREIINLENKNACPPFASLLWDERLCIHHAQMPMFRLYTCALNNAYRLKKWLKSNARLFELDQKEERQIKARLQHICDDSNVNSDESSMHYFQIGEGGEDEVDYEQHRGFAVSADDTTSHCGCFSSGSDPANVGETNCICL